MRKLIPYTALFIVAALSGLIACAGTQSLPRLHPEEITSAPLCSDCHDSWQSALDHDSTFGKDHRFASARGDSVCRSCHQPSFCADCHAGEEDELKPSDKFKDSPGRDLPHRGDYLTQHRIDGRINPAPCFRCHGRRNDWRCKECHR